MEAITQMFGKSPVYPMQNACLPFYDLFSQFFPSQVRKDPENFAHKLLFRIADGYGSETISR